MFPPWHILLRQDIKSDRKTLNKILASIFLSWNRYLPVRSCSKSIQEWSNVVGTRFTFFACACTQLIALLSGQLNSIRLPPYTPSLGFFSGLLWLRQCGSTPGHLSWSTRIAGIATPAPTASNKFSLRFRFALLIIAQIYRFARIFLFVDSGFLVSLNGKLFSKFLTLTSILISIWILL